ncbi:MAG: CoA-binding protein [Gammaproteobacteria bacterium]|nr:CoA-binding protein [Gammaproteobacteria bacterium]
MPRAKEHRVVVLGASPKPHRYSNMAIRELLSRDYRVIPVHPRAARIEHLAVVPELRMVRMPVHTLTLYVNPMHSRPLRDEITAMKPHRVIFNPGTESQELERYLKEHEIPFIHGCTLVMLRTGQF